MKNVKIYPKRIAIMLSMFLAIPIVSIVAHVTDIHFPSGEEINMMQPEMDEVEREFAHIQASQQEVEMPKEVVIELTEEQEEFQRQRVWDGCNGVEDK